MIPRLAKCEGEEIDLEIFEGNLPPNFNIEWLKDGQIIPGETGATLTIDETGTYTVDIQGASNCDDSDSILVEFIAAPEVQNQNDLDITVCEPFNSDASFDLTVNDDKVIGTQDQDDFDVSYYQSQSDADNANNPITDPDYLHPRSG